MLKLIEDRKKHIETVNNYVSNVPYSWKELSLAIEGRGTNLRIWIGNEFSIAKGCGRKMIHIRLDCRNQYSTPLSNETANYLNNDSKEINSLLSFYEFGKTDISKLDEILEITKTLKYRELPNW